VTELAVSVPSKRVSAWSVETNPKYARAWLASLLPVDNVDSTRELYQSLYALNRMDLDVAQRFELMGLYRAPVNDALGSFQSAFGRASFPLSSKLRQLAEFICQLHIEMAYGYKLCVQDLSRQWLPWRRRQLLAPAAERALYHLGEVLLRSYQLYLPYPPGVWRDIYALYWFVNHYGRQDELVNVDEKAGVTNVSVSQRYRHLLMLGLASPYQMPSGECLTVYRFLARWIQQVRVEKSATRTDSVGCFVVNPTSDVPPVAMGRAPSNRTNFELSILDTSELVRTLHVFLRRMEKGETAGELEMGVEGLDSACHDMLQRLHRAYGQTALRRHSRIKRHETVFVCGGIGAIHFFASGQKPLVSATAAADVPLRIAELPMAAVTGTDETPDETYVALDEPTIEQVASGDANKDSFRIDRWQVRDVSPQGLLLVQDGGSSAKFRVGDVLGIQRTGAVGQWSIGIVRWFRAQGKRGGFEVGVELIAPDATAASIRAVEQDSASDSAPVLLLPAVDVVHRPASLLAPRGALQVGKDFFLAEADRGMRRVRVLDTIERTGSIEQVIVGNVLE